MDQQKRSFSRVATRLAAYARRVSSAAARPLFSAENQHDLPQADEAKLRMASLPEGFVEYLQALDAKMDILIGMISRSQIQADFPLTLDVTEISGAGMKFTCPEPLALGDHLEVVLILSQYPLEMAGAIGKIIRQEDDAGQAILIMAFTTIRDRDQEAVARFVLQEERELLRRQKWA